MAKKINLFAQSHTDQGAKLRSVWLQDPKSMRCPCGRMEIATFPLDSYGWYNN